jgi:pyrimidine operon attenuation protein/uracil phosphoribosyltransferase
MPAVGILLIFDGAHDGRGMRAGVDMVVVERKKILGFILAVLKGRGEDRIPTRGDRLT